MSKKIILLLSNIALILLVSHPLCGKTKNTDSEMNIGTLIQPLSEDGIFRDSCYYNWGGSIIKDNDGLYHLFYSRWKRSYTFNGWLTASEVAHATSPNSTGPWEYKETVLKGRGKDHWDAITAHNPKIKYFEGKYYLYYIATNMGDKAYTDQDITITKEKKLNSNTWKILRTNQRTGIAVSNSINGPWKRSDMALIEPSGPIATITVNPAIAKGKDDIYYLIIKGDKPNETRFIRNQAIATSTSPAGPFIMQDRPVIANLDTEDVSMWYNDEDGHFYAIFHAHKFIGLMSSKDGLQWEKAVNYKVTDKEVLFDDGSILSPGRMERPFVYLEDGAPKVLCLAIKKGDDSYTIFIPLQEK